MAQAVERATAFHRIGPQVLCVLLGPLFFTSSIQAQVYKWVDANGQTHYSQRKADARGINAAEVKILPPPAAAMTSTPSAEYLRAQSKFAPQTLPSTQNDFVPPRQQALSDGRDHGTDASRCALARDVLSGAVRHTNGKPTDQYDREVAQNDISVFCKAR